MGIYPGIYISIHKQQKRAAQGETVLIHHSFTYPADAGLFFKHTAEPQLPRLISTMLFQAKSHTFKVKPTSNTVFPHFSLSSDSQNENQNPA